MNLVHSNSPCQRVRPLLDSYVSNELLVETNHDILRHIGDCAQCRSALREIEGTRNAVRRAVGRIAPPPDLRNRIQRSLEGPQAVKMPRRPVASRWLMAAAAVTAVVLSVGILRNLAVSRNAGHVLRAGWVDHKECVLGGHLPAKPPSRDQAERRLAAHAGLLGIVEAAMPDYELRQAHECTVEGRRYTHIAMERAGDVVSVSLVRKNSGESLASPQSATIQGVAVYGFDSGEYLGFVMGSNAGGDLPRLAERLTPRIQKVLQTL